jgi:predicted RNase H-like nuclease
MAIGIDGCKGGWIVASRAQCSQKTSVYLASTILAALSDSDCIIAIDIPIGLCSIGLRACDAAARALLPPSNRASVFSAPARPVLSCKTYQEANQLSRQLTDKGMSIQAWNICSKINEVDLFLQTNSLNGRIHEVHPELSFRAWSKSDFLASKKSPEGKTQRRLLVENYFNLNVLKIRKEIGAKFTAEDDILDALAALWSAERITNNQACSVLKETQIDSLGFEMQIRF